MATPGNLRKIHLAAARASDEVANYLFGFFNTEVAKALRSTIIRFDKIPKTMAERDELLTEALAAAAAAVRGFSDPAVRGHRDPWTPQPPPRRRTMMLRAASRQPAAAAYH